MNIHLPPICSNAPKESDFKLAGAQSNTCGTTATSATGPTLLKALRVIKVLLLDVDNLTPKSETIRCIQEIQKKTEEEFAYKCPKTLSQDLVVACRQFLNEKDLRDCTQCIHVLSLYDQMLNFSCYEIEEDLLRPPINDFKPLRVVFVLNLVRYVATRHFKSVSRNTRIKSEGLYNQEPKAKPGQRAFLAKIEKDRNKIYTYGIPYIFILVKRMCNGTEGSIFQFWSLEGRNIAVKIGKADRTAVYAIAYQEFILEQIYQRAAEQKLLDAQGKLRGIIPPRIASFRIYSKNIIAFASEFYENGDLYSEVQRSPSKKRCIDVGMQISDILNTLTKLKVIHCDIKLQNFLVDRCGQIYLNDWSRAYFLDIPLRTNFKKFLYSPAGATRLFRSTKARKDIESALPSFNPKAELGAETFSAGVALHLFATNKYPFAVSGENRLLEDLPENHFANSNISPTSPAASLIKKMCTYVPIDEASIAETAQTWREIYNNTTKETGVVPLPPI